MLSIKHLHNFNRSFNYINNYSGVMSKAYYCNKKPIVLNTTKEAKDKKYSESEKSKLEAGENLSFENEEQILQTVILEKEKDANVRSRLSKECNKLADNKIRISSSGLNLHLEHSTTKSTCWEDYQFDKTVDNLKKHTLMASTTEVKWIQDGICSTRKQSGGGDGITATDNRIVRGEPGKVLFAFIPEEWFKFFIPKTGVSGFGTFLFTFITFLVSKEYYVLEHNYYNGLGVLCFWWGAIKYVGPHVAKYLDKEIQKYENAWQQGRNDNKRLLEEQIEDEKLLQFQAEGELMLIDAKRENVHLQLEEEFRFRQMTVYREVVQRLNYQVVIGEVYKRIFHKNLVDYVTKEVKKSIGPEMEKELFNISIENLIIELDKGDKH